MHSDFAKLCEPVARIMWGEPSNETASESPEARSPNCVRQRAAKVRRRSDFGRTVPFTILPARCHGPEPLP
jgi:hypothetical protein